jgi:hypothetical protein
MKIGGDTNVLYREGLRGHVFAQDGTAHTARGVGKRNGKRFGRILYHKRLTTHITINTIKGI